MLTLNQILDSAKIRKTGNPVSVKYDGEVFVVMKRDDYLYSTEEINNLRSQLAAEKLKSKISTASNPFGGMFGGK